MQNIRTIILPELVEHIEAGWQTFNRQSPVDVVLENLIEYRHVSKMGYVTLMANKEFRQIIQSQDADLVILDAIMGELSLPAVDQLKVHFIFYSPTVATPWNCNSISFLKLPEK